MKEYDIKDCFLKADDHYYTAMNLYAMYIADSFPYHRFDPLSKIANNCELSGELNIKAYMGENNIAFEKTHSLEIFIDKCTDRDGLFSDLKKDVSLLSGYTSKVNYPNDIHINQEIIKRTIESARNIIFFEEILKLRYKYGIQLPMPDEEIRNKMIRDEGDAYIMALERHQEKIGMNITKHNISKIKIFLRDNHLGLLQNIEKAQGEILRNDRKFGAYRILLKSMPEILSKSKGNQPNFEKSTTQKKYNRKMDNDMDIGR
jgi:hypothetical protein